MGKCILINIGEKAPEFTLPDMDLKNQNLRDHIGKRNIVLAFFPLAFSPVCTKEMCSFRDSQPDLNNLDAQVIGISVDSPFTLKAFAQQEGYKFLFLSDFNRDVSKLYGVLHEEALGFRGISKRSIFIIDKKGTIRYKWVSEDSGKEPDYQTVKQALEKLS
jgi:peroxiredoxin